jgi:hypothetical protein
LEKSNFFYSYTGETKKKGNKMNKINSHINTIDNSEPILINIDELIKKYPVLKENSLDNNVIIDEKVITEVFAENDFGNLFMILLGADSGFTCCYNKKNYLSY